MKHKNFHKIAIRIGIISLIASDSEVYADMSYGGKFITTTLGSCAVGAAGAYSYADITGYDPQPKQIVTFLGATTGCITGALFSYLFYGDNTSNLQTKISEQEKIIQDLSSQISNDSSSNSFKNIAKLPNPFDDLRVKEGVAKFSIDSKNLPPGLNVRNCSHLWRFNLKDDGSEIDLGNPQKNRVIAVNKNFALVGFSFLYSPEECFSPSLPDGFYAERFFPGLTPFLEQRVINWSADKANYKEKKD